MHLFCVFGRYTHVYTSIEESYYYEINFCHVYTCNFIYMLQLYFKLRIFKSLIIKKKRDLKKIKFNIKIHTTFSVKMSYFLAISERMRNFLSTIQNSNAVKENQSNFIYKTLPLVANASYLMHSTKFLAPRFFSK